MISVDRYPHRFREIAPVWIPMPDGCRLSARLWLPDTAEARPVPTIFEYIPYRQRDAYAMRDAVHHRYMAGHGYACLRVDIRGSGESDGILRDEYLQRELDDGVEIIRWIAAQPWSSGAVGMMGLSWGGFNSLQIAALRPPALKAIVTVCSTDDRYADDMHYTGGCLNHGTIQWGSCFFAFNSRPPDPMDVGARWREMWRHRLDEMTLPIAEWLRHQRRDHFWRHGSVCESYSDIGIPVYAVGGWADGYSNAIPRLLENLRAPRKGLIGPWAHLYPHLEKLHPIGFIQDMLRWWDRWLKHEQNGVENEPMLRVWIEDSAAPAEVGVDGRWVVERSWPPPSVRPHRLYLGQNVLSERAAAAGELVHEPDQTIGLAGGLWNPFGHGDERPGDQRGDDQRSLSFDSEPLHEPLVILGAPEVTLTLSVDRPVALVAVRLCDVASDGTSTRVSYGLLNLTHSKDHSRVEPVVPGGKRHIRVKLNHIGHRFKAGRRIRIAVSSCYWPLAWPSPEPVRLTLITGEDSSLNLPLRPDRPEDACEPVFPPAEGAALEDLEAIKPIERRIAIETDSTGLTTMTIVAVRYAIRRKSEGLEVEASVSETYRIRADDPLSATMTAAWSINHRRRDWRIRSESTVNLSATKSAFRLLADVKTFDGETLFAERSWDETIPRDGI
jgi:uncharacterized protein